MHVFEIEQHGETVVLIPQENLTEFDFDRIEQAGAEVLARLNASQAQHVVIDFHLTDYYGSTAIGFFVKLWKRVRAGGGQMAFCNVSDHEREILKLTKLNTLWSVCDNRDDAMRTVMC